jgi:hypothetical protein
VESTGLPKPEMTILAGLSDDDAGRIAESSQAWMEERSFSRLRGRSGTAKRDPSLACSARDDNPHRIVK